MELYLFLIFITVIISFILISHFFSKEKIIKRKLKKAPYKQIEQFKDRDIAKLTGKVVLIGEPLIAPLSNRKCALYYIHVERKVSSGKHSRWETFIEEEVSSKFLINEGNHYAYINDANVNYYIVQDKKYKSGFLNDATATLENYLNKKKLDSKGFLGFNRTIRYNEGILEIREEIAVFGKGIWKEAKDLNLPKKYGRVLEITATENMEVYASDDPSTTLKNVKIKDSKNNFIERYE